MREMRPRRTRPWVRQPEIAAVAWRADEGAATLAERPNAVGGLRPVDSPQADDLALTTRELNQVDLQLSQTVSGDPLSWNLDGLQARIQAVIDTSENARSATGPASCWESLSSFKT